MKIEKLSIEEIRAAETGILLILVRIAALELTKRNIDPEDIHDLCD